MATGEEAAAGSASSGQSGSGSHLPWHLIPSFEPGETDLVEYSKRLEFLGGLWPPEFLSQLAPRAALLCKGSAFQKVLRIQPEKLKVNSLEGVKLIVKTLGGVWGKTVLEDRYEKFERAIYGISQKADESNESYMARHEILFEDMLAQGSSINDVRAYCLLRNSALSPEDKKRVLIEAKGDLKYETVTSAIRMLGAKFFHEVQGQQKQYRGKTYEVNHVQEHEDEVYHMEEQSVLMAANSNDLPESLVEQCAQHGDEDALVVQQFEEAIIEAVQNDSEMAVYTSTYLDARKRLLDKSRNRGFWPVRSKGAGKKGKSKGKNRKPLAVRIAESNCKICNEQGHWKWECPRRFAGGSSQPSMPSANKGAASVNVMISEEDLHEDADVFVVEHGLATPAQPIVKQAGSKKFSESPKKSHSHVINVCNYIQSPPKSQTTHNKQLSSMFMHQFREKMSRAIAMNQSNVHRKTGRESCETPSPKEGVTKEQSDPSSFSHSCPPGKGPLSLNPLTTNVKIISETALFATSMTTGIVDLGASQTVMGQHQLEEFLNNIPAEIRPLIQERKVSMSFRFGNNSIVPCRRAIFVPVDQFWIKIAIVESRTPFLISNSVCRNLGAVIDTTEQTIFFRKLDCTLPLSLSGKNLFLLDFCALLDLKPPRQTEIDSQKPLPAESVLTCHENAAETTESQTVQSSVEVPASENNTPSQPQALISSDKSVLEPLPALSSDHHVQCQAKPEPDRALRCHPELREEGPSGRTDSSDEHASACRDDNHLRPSQAGTEVWRCDRIRPSILPMVSGKVWQQPEDGAPHVCALFESLDRAKGVGEGTSKCSQRQDDGQARLIGHCETCPALSEPWANRPGCGRRSVGRDHGSDAGQYPSRGECSAPGSSRRCTEACSEPAPDFDQSSQRTMNTAQHFLIEQCIQEFNAYVQSLDDKSRPSVSSTKSNWVYDEMMQYLKKHGHQHRQRSLIDVLEVYCSSESQLTKQCIRQGLKTVRFGLAQGDLNTFEGRCKLYEI